MERQAKDGTVYTMVGEDQWQPVTRQAKDGTTYKKMGADSWSPLDAQPQAETPAAMSAVRKGLQGATAGFSDEAAGAVEAAGRALGFEGAGVGSIADIKKSSDGPTLDWEILRDAYQKARDKEREALKKDSKDNPKISATAEIAGAIASPLNKIMPNASIAKSGAVIGGITGLGASEADNALDMAKDTATGVALGYGFGSAAEKAAPIVGKGIEKVSDVKNKVGQYFKKGAEELADNATGATRVQAEKFQKGSGRYLLDNKIVGFGDTAEDVAKSANKAISKAEKGIDESLKTLDAQGVQVSQDRIIETLQKQIKDLSKDSSKADVVKKLNSIVDDIINTGESNISASNAEQVKRGFNKMAKNWQDPEKGEAGKIAYRAYRDAVENTAQAADPAIAKAFKDAKGVYGKLSPIADAAEKRAAQLNQSPIGGLLDTAAVIGGAVGSDDPATGMAAGMGTALLRRKVSPRIASSMAVTFDKISQQLIKNPEMAKIAQVNPQAFRATVNNLVESFMESGQSKNIPFPRAAESERPQKGPEKWANDGIENILKANQSDIDRDTLEKLKSTKEGKMLLFEASGAKDKKAMERVLQKIRSASRNEGE